MIEDGVTGTGLGADLDLSEIDKRCPVCEPVLKYPFGAEA